MFLIALPVVFSGLFMIVGFEWDRLSGQYITGLGLGLLTAVCYASFLLLIRHIQSEKDSPVFYYQVLVTGSASAFLGLAVSAGGHSFILAGWSSFAALFALGFLCQAVAWAAISQCLPQINASRAGLILLLQPALSFVWDVLFFGRPTNFVAWTGAVMVVAGIYMGSLRQAAD